MKRTLSNDEAQANGINSNHELMDNGEYRFRLTSTDGTAYIRTVSGKNGGWQKSHFHKRVRETFIVEKGGCLYVEKKDGQLRRTYYSDGAIFTTCPPIPHNLYVFPDTVLHTVKHSATGMADSDWHACPELDAELLETESDPPNV